MNNKIQTTLANDYLEKPFSYPGMIERKNIIESLRIWVYPSFEPFVSFTIASDEGEHYIRRVIWEHRTRTMTDEPQTYCGEIKVDQSVSLELNSTLSAICHRQCKTDPLTII